MFNREDYWKRRNNVIKEKVPDGQTKKGKPKFKTAIFHRPLRGQGEYPVLWRQAVWTEKDHEKDKCSKEDIGKARIAITRMGSTRKQYRRKIRSGKVGKHPRLISSHRDHKGKIRLKLQQPSPTKDPNKTNKQRFEERKEAREAVKK